MQTILSQIWTWDVNSLLDDNPNIKYISPEINIK